MTTCIFKLKIYQSGAEAILSVTALDKQDAKAKFKKFGFNCDVEWIFQ